MEKSILKRFFEKYGLKLTDLIWKEFNEKGFYSIYYNYVDKISEDILFKIFLQIVEYKLNKYCEIYEIFLKAQNSMEFLSLKYLLNKNYQYVEIIIPIIENDKSLYDFYYKLPKIINIKEKEIKYQSESKIMSNPHLKKFYILSIDGGGSKIVSSLSYLEAIEKMLGTDKFIGNYFDLIAGTSSGSIMASYIALMNNNKNLYACKELFDEFFPLIKKIFPTKKFYDSIWTYFKAIINSTPFYSHDNLLEVLKKLLGEKTKLKDVVKTLLIPTIEINKNMHSSTKVFTNKTECNEERNINLTDVVAASCSAPFYFDNYLIKGKYYYDGGITNNNPSLLAYEYAVNNLKINPENIVMISIGTGEFELETGKGFAKIFRNIADLLIKSQSNDIERKMQNLLKPNQNYFRINPKFSESIDLDAADDENLVKCRSVASHYIEKNLVLFEKIREILRKKFN